MLPDKDLNEVVNREIDKYNQRKAKIFYEAAFGELLSQFSAARAVEIINSYMDQLGESNVSERKGWQCPVCLTVHNPDVKVCVKCTQKEQTTPTGPQLLQE
jgi:hypothetical protein